MLTKADISWLKDEFLRDVVDEVSKRVGEKIDALYTKLDAFVGDVKTRREEEDLHRGQHDAIDEQLLEQTSHIRKIEKHLHLTSVGE